MNKRTQSVLAAVVVLAVGAGVMLLLTSFKAEAAKGEEPLKIRTVRTAELTALPQNVWIEADGFLKPGRQLEIQSPVTGRVTASLNDLKGGLSVAQGDILISLDDRRARIAFESARTDMIHRTTQFLSLASLDEETRNKWNRYVAELERASVHDLPSLPQSDHRQELLAVTKGVAAAGYQLDSAALDLMDHTLIAPFSGILSGEGVVAGSWVSPGVPLATLIEINPMELSLSLPAGDLIHISENAAVTITRPEDNKSVLGILSRIEPLLTSGSQMARVHISVTVPDEELWLPGSFVRAVIGGERFESAYRVPRETLVENRIPLFEEGKLVLKEVTLLARDGTDVLLAPDLPTGSEYVVTILQNPLEGMLLQKEEDQ